MVTFEDDTKTLTIGSTNSSDEFYTFEELEVRDMRDFLNEVIGETNNGNQSKGIESETISLNGERDMEPGTQPTPVQR